MKIIIESQFLPPAVVFAHFARAKEIVIEACENYQKRSFRNRFIYLGAGGIQSFSIPLKKGKNEQLPIRDTQISYDQNWIAQLRKQVQSAYGKSAFYDYYEDLIFDCINKKYNQLFELNHDIISLLSEVLGIEVNLAITENFEADYGKDYCDLRNKWSPLDRGMDERKLGLNYPQVFEYKYGFTDGLSILDLIFNMGPESLGVLKQYQSSFC
jgi:hypothetical protein